MYRLNILGISVKGERNITVNPVGRKTENTGYCDNEEKTERPQSV